MTRAGKLGWDAGTCYSMNFSGGIWFIFHKFHKKKLISESIVPAEEAEQLFSNIGELISVSQVRWIAKQKDTLYMRVFLLVSDR